MPKFPLTLPQTRSKMKLSDFDYKLPEELIADKPIEPRDHSRLLVLDKITGEIKHKHFYDVVRHLHKDDILVVNNSKVFPARLIGEKEITHGKVEILLEHEIEQGLWKAVGRGLDVNKRVIFPNSPLEAIVKTKVDDTYEILFSISGERFFSEIERIGQMPLPPYIVRKRTDQGESGNSPIDKERYQTVYAAPRGSAAAPTAGLHFTPELLDQIRSMGVKVLEVTLHVGLGTFAPVKAENILEHKMHSEFYSVSSDVIREIIAAKNVGSRIISVGTTTTRVLEHIFCDPLIRDTSYVIRDLSGWTNIFIYPGYEFKCIDGMITNFHLPKSTLLMLVSALAGRKNILKAYNEAIRLGYRFYSYGDAMLIL